MNNSEINMMVFSMRSSLRSGLLENHTELGVRVACVSRTPFVAE